MDIRILYKDFIKASRQPCRRGDSKRGAKIHQYMEAKQKLFEALKDYYIAGKLCSDRADEIVRTISKSMQNPECFWGSSKTAKSNQAIFVHEKNERLFEELLRCWIQLPEPPKEDEA